MASIFISHSSQDKVLATRLAEDLQRLGHTAWLDSWEIRIGDCIVTKVERGLADATAVLVLLSNHAVKSHWVGREWKAKYWEEIESNDVRVLPALLDDCEVPPLLKSKRYADLRGERYATGLVEIAQALPAPPILMTTSSATSSMMPDSDKRVTTLLANLHSGATLSSCMAEALQLAMELCDENLRLFCQNELTGYHSAVPTPAYRCVETYVSGTAEINPLYWGWNGNPSAALEHAARDTENFRAMKLAVGEALAALENQAGTGKPSALLVWTVPVGSINPAAKKPEAKVRCYARGDALQSTMDRIRTELTTRLVALLPAAKRPDPDA